ncbi:MAG: serine/threonine protein kinase [Candidatus Cloacimonetes bacterium]|jgi:serine/threonine protein kinase|nr:serine/threonine protein kinase [Candidatus Cloacimonadota bacterium]
MEDIADALIRDFQFLRRLGQGGMGEVWLARDQALDRLVAIKILYSDISHNPDTIARFCLEGKLQANLIHKNIVTLHTFFEEGGSYYMVMEYASGITLKDMIKQFGILPEHRVTGILYQIVDALGYAHSRGIIHRDIKPSNIMIDINNGDFVKIMDFGIAKALGDRGLTKTGTRMGTLYYMSPEQVRAEKDIDHRTDIYSLGITLFEMLTGRLPYDYNTDSDYEILHQIVTKEIPDSYLDSLQISQVLKDAIMGMTAKDKNQRYGSINEVIAQKTGSFVTNVSDANPQPKTGSIETRTKSNHECYYSGNDAKTEINSPNTQDSPEPKDYEIQSGHFIRRTTDRIVGVFLLFIILSFYFSADGKALLSWKFWGIPVIVALPSIVVRINGWKRAFIPVLWIASILFMLWQFLVLGFFVYI